jgi:LysM repeat protein
MPLRGNSVAPQRPPSQPKSDGPSNTETKPHVAPQRQSVGEVARAHGVKKAAILDANPRLRHTPVLAQGDRVEIPQDRESKSKQYEVKRGDTPTSVAERHGVSEQALRDENGLEPHDRLEAGDVLNVPDSEIGQTGRTSWLPTVGSTDTELRTPAHTSLLPVAGGNENDLSLYGYDDGNNGGLTPANHVELVASENTTESPEITAAASRTDDAAAQVVATRLPPPELMNHLPPAERTEMIASANAAKSELDEAVKAEIEARTNALSYLPVDTDALRGAAADTIRARMEGSQLGAVTASIERVEFNRMAELATSPIESAQQRTDEAAQALSDAEQKLTDLQASGVPPVYIQTALTDAREDIAVAQQELHNAVSDELALRMANHTIPSTYVPDPLAYYAEQIGDRIGTTPSTLETLQSATLAQRVISSADNGGPEQAMEQLRELTPGVSDDVMRLAMADPSMQRVTDEIADFVSVEVEDAYDQWGVPYDATDKLAELTAGLPPDVAAKVIETSMPIIEKAVDEAIANGIHGYYAVFESLANAVGNAEGTPAGEAVTAEVAGLVKEKLDALGDDGARHAISLAARLGENIGSGTNANLSIELAGLYAADGDREIGNSTAAEIGDLFLSHAATGLETLKYSYEEAMQEYAKQSEELGWILGSGPGKDATDAERQAIIADYRSKHPDLAAAEERLNELGALALRNANALTALPPELENSPSAEAAAKAAASFLNDPNVAFAVSVSEDAQTYVSELMDRSDAGEETLLDNLANISKWIDKPKGFMENMGSLVTKSIVGKTMEALGPNGQNFDVASQQLDRLENYADFLGLDRSKLSSVVDQYKIALNPDATPEARAAALSQVNTELNDVKGGAFDITTGLGRTLRGAGLLLAVAGGGKSIQDTLNDPNAQNIAGLLVESAGFARDSAEFVSAFMKSADWTDSAWFKGSGKVLGVAGAFIGGLSVLQSLADGNYAEAGFGAVGVGGTLLVAFGTTTAWTGVGAVLVIGAFVGSEIYKAVTDDEHENANTVAALRIMGFDEAAAEALKNQDADLNSPVPVLMALARHTGIDMDDPAQRKGFVDYINSLDKSQLEKLVGIAHGIDPKDDGTYPETAGNDTHVINGPPPGRGADTSPHSLTALEAWMGKNGFKVPPTL